MKKANKMVLILVFFSLILATFFQIPFLKPLDLKDNEISYENILSKPKSQASYQQFYDWDDGNNMTIEANPDNNWTTTTIESDGELFEVDSLIKSDSAGVSLNNSREIYSEGPIGKTITFLKPITIDGIDLNAEVSHNNNRFFVYYEPAAWFYNATMEAKKNTIGNYLDKTVQIDRLDNLLDGDFNSLKNSILLLYFHLEKTPSLDLIYLFLSKVVKSEPLGIVICNDKRDFIFEVLLEILSKIKTSHHIMTKTCMKKDFMEDFFMATWPADESFDLWKNFSIIFLGNEKDYCLFKKDLDQFLNIKST